MDMVIPPASAGTTGFAATDNDHGRHGGHGYGHGYDGHDRPAHTAERVKDEMSRQAVSANEQTRDILRDIATQGAAGSSATEKTGSAGILATNVASGAVTVAVERIGAAGQLATNVAGQQVQNLALQHFNLLSVQASTHQAATNLAIQTVASAGILQAVKDAAAAQLYAAQNHAAALAVAAECCCATKELIREEASKTRDLIRENQSANLAVQLADAKNEVLVLRARLPIAA